MNKLIFPVFLIIVILTAGCVTFEEPGTGLTCIDPEKLIEGRCCFDEDNNNVCDIDERECPACDDENPCTSDHCSFDTGFECRHDKIRPCCGNGECDESEDIANECPEDCVIIQMTDFFHMYSGPDYMEGDSFVFIHTGSNETDKRPDFYVNITAGDKKIRNIRTTYNCTDSATTHKIDSIDVDMVEVIQGYSELGYENKFESDDYTIYTSFFSLVSKTWFIEINELDPAKTVEFRVRIKKNQYKVRSKLTCDFDFYFLDPLKRVRTQLKISYI